MKFLNTGTASSISPKTVAALEDADIGAIAIIVGRRDEVLRTYEKIECAGNSRYAADCCWKVHDDKTEKPTLLASDIVASVARTYPYRLVLFDNSFEAFAALAAEKL